MAKRIKQIAPWLIAAIAIGAILYKYRPSEIASEMQRGNLLAMVPWAVLLIGGAIFVLSASDHQIITGCVKDEFIRPSYWTLFRGRCATQLLGMLGYAAGVGGHGVWLARVTGAGVGLSGGMVLYIMSADLVAVSFVAGMSIWVADVTEAGALRWVAPSIAAVLLFLKIYSPHGIFSEEQLPAVFRPWKRTSSRHGLSGVLLRTSNIYLVTLCVWAAARGFGMAIPLGVWMAYFPVILVVASMPVNIAGFGAVQGAWLMFEPWAASGEQVLAFSVLWSLVVAVCITLRGLPFVKGVVAEVAR